MILGLIIQSRAPCNLWDQKRREKYEPAFGAQIYFGIQWVSDENGCAAGGVP
jgi:hypothetical protein